MHDVIDKLTPEQALEVVVRLSDKGGGIRDAVLAEARAVLSEVDLDKVAEDGSAATVVDAASRFVAQGGRWTPSGTLARLPDDAALGRAKFRRL
jgi:hypothetical protein